MFFFFQAEDGIRDLVRSRGLGDVYKRQVLLSLCAKHTKLGTSANKPAAMLVFRMIRRLDDCCLLYTSDAADERSSVDLGGRRIIKKKNNRSVVGWHEYTKRRLHD